MGRGDYPQNRGGYKLLKQLDDTFVISSHMFAMQAKRVLAYALTFGPSA